MAAAGAVVQPEASAVGSTVAGTGPVIEAGAHVTRGVLFDDAQAGRGALASDSVLSRGGRVVADVVREGAVIGAGTVIGWNEARSGARVSPDVTLGVTSVRQSTEV